MLHFGIGSFCTEIICLPSGANVYPISAVLIPFAWFTPDMPPEMSFEPSNN